MSAKSTIKKTLVILPLTLLCAGVRLPAPAMATELIYQPVNPTFGGNAFNGSWLLAQAEAQNKHEKPITPSSSDPLDDFEASMVRRILSVLSSRIVDTAFGLSNEDLAAGSYEFGDYLINIAVNEGDNIRVSITDSASGSTTEVEVPYY